MKFLNRKWWKKGELGNDKYPPRFVWGTWEKDDSWVELGAVRIVRNLMFAAAAPATIADYVWRSRTDKIPPKWWAEVWVLSLIALATAFLFVPGLSQTIVGLALAACILVDNLSVVVSNLTAPSITSESRIRSGTRLVYMILLNVIEVVMAFAVLLLHYGEAFRLESCGQPLASPLTALYLSALTFTTLGYGDITPVTPVGRLLVVLELCFFLLVLVTRLPQAIALHRFKETERKGQDPGPSR